MSLAISVTFVAHTPARASDMEQMKSDISTWAASLQSNNRRVVMKATPWDQVLSLSNVSTTADTDIDLTANTSATATHVILKIAIDNTNTTEGSFIRLRPKGAGIGTDTSVILRGPQVSTFHADYPAVIVPMSAARVITYNINSNVNATTVEIRVIGYIEPALA